MMQAHLKLPIGVTVRDPSGARYVIEGLLTRGKGDAVYLVRDRQSKQVFALKEVVDPSSLDRERFLFEGEVLKQLRHPALPRVYRVFEHEQLKRVYLLMDYIGGQNLEEMGREQPAGRYSLPVALSLLAPIVDAVSYLHTQEPPIVHRDLKPANILMPVGANETMLVNFGFAKHYIADATTALIRRGTSGYAAPEQYWGGTTPRTDIYGLGATLYTLLTGITPPDAISRVMRSKGTDPLKLAHLLTPTIPVHISEVIGRAMSIREAQRFATVKEFWWALTG